MNESKIINDPVFGFIKLPGGLLLDIIKHPLMQRLTRIKQLGMAPMVYPGAQHTRFLHSIGAFHLTYEAILSLMHKGIFIFDSEAEAVEAAILMHDIGHGPFSHVLEYTLIHGISHEEISILMMEQINKEMGGRLNLAINIFKDEYPKRFLHQLISSQLDMDRLDYLRRDSFFTGVTEGNIGSARIIKMLNVVDDSLVVEAKSIYSIENFLTSRRLMYWSVYLHKTVVAGERVLINALNRAKYLVSQGYDLWCSTALRYFLSHHVDAKWFKAHPEALTFYEQLDDSDIWCALKEWSKSSDKILAMLSSDILNRKLFKVEVRTTPPTESEVDDLKASLAKRFSVSFDDAQYLMSVGSIEKDMYDMNEDHITILYKDGTTKDIAEASELLNVELLSKKIRKYYLCYQRF